MDASRNMVFQSPSRPLENLPIWRPRSWWSRTLARVGGRHCFEPVGGYPFRHKPPANRQQRWSKENADEAERERPAEHAKEYKDERHVASLADEPRFDNIINVGHPQTPDDHKNPPTGRALM